MRHRHIFVASPWTPSPSPSPPNTLQFPPPPPSKPQTNFNFSQPLIAMVVIIATAFVIITYSRFLSRRISRTYRRYKRWRRSLRRYVPSSSAGEIESPPYEFDPTDGFHLLSPYGLDESIIKTIPLTVYTRKSGLHDCAVCLLQFDVDDYVRTLPNCSHAFHVDCIDIWLRSHANCPLCRAGIFRQGSPFTPLMAGRIRPNLDDVAVTAILEPLPEINVESEIQEQSPRQSIESEERIDGRHFLLKRSYSFSFERNLGADRLVLEPATASPWQYRQGRGGGVGSFWSKRPSPFNLLMNPTLFPFHNNRGGMKSPFSRWRTDRMAGLSSGGSSSKKSKIFASPMFMRPAVGSMLSSSRQRSGDPEALLSPVRFSRR